MSRGAKFIAPLPVTDWPAVDQIAWSGALADDPLQPGGLGGAAAWRPSTRRMAEISYGVWLAWLNATGRLEPPARPAQRATLECMREFLNAMRWAGYSDQSCATRLRCLAAALGAMDPSFNRKVVSRAAGRIAASAQRARPLHARSQSPDDLLNLASRLMKDADSGEGRPIDAAVAYRDGLLLALLVHRPLRISNLAAIRVDRHLVRTNSGYRLQFDASEMKAHRPYNCSVPHELDRPLRRYLSEHRPRLQGLDAGAPVSEHLWLTSAGRPLKQASVAAIIRRRTGRQFGIGMGPHLMRHIIGTAVAEHSPERVGDVAIILGHQSYETSERHYVHARAAQSVGALDEALNAIATRSRVR